MSHAADPGQRLELTCMSSTIKTIFALLLDYYSKWIEMDPLPDESSKTTIEALKGHFARYGIPDEVISDNGPQFADREFANFAKDYEFNHTTTSPCYPQANGQVKNKQ